MAPRKQSRSTITGRPQVADPAGDSSATIAGRPKLTDPADDSTATTAGRPKLTDAADDSTATIARRPKLPGGRSRSLATGRPKNPPPALFDASQPPQTTGRYIIIFKHPALEDTGLVKATLNKFAGVKSFARFADYKDAAITGKELADADVMHFHKTGIVVLGANDDRLQSLSASAMDASSPILAIEPEYVIYAAGMDDASLQYLKGYRDAVNALYDQLAGNGSPSMDDAEEMAAAFADNNQFTWGLQATRVGTSRYSGQGVKLAVLDTGFDLQHPDFQGRAIVAQSFVPGALTVQDGHGHGTHCIGTACGPRRPAGSRRYGCAYDAQIHVGKVLNDQGSGTTGNIVAGIEWAMSKGCQIVSMSLGGNIDQKIKQYEVPIRRALAAGTFIAAAAGNNADRAAGDPGFVSAPANADAAMAVAALDSRLAVANFSARSSLVTGDGGKVNIAGPGVDVYSSWPEPARYNTISGTSMATPHVAGIAAMWCQATGATGAALWTKLTQNAHPLTGASAADVGSGLVQAPQ